MGDPKLAEVEAPSKEEAERLTAHLGSTGTIPVPMPEVPRGPTQEGPRFQLSPGGRSLIRLPFQFACQCALPVLVDINAVEARFWQLIAFDRHRQTSCFF